MRLARAVQANVKRLDNRTERHPKQAATRRVAHQYQKHDTKPATRLQGGAKGVPRRSGMSFGNPVCRQMRGSINLAVSRGMGKNPPRFRCDHFSHVSRTYPSRRNMGSRQNVWSAVELQGKSMGREICLRKCIRPFGGGWISWP